MKDYIGRELYYQSHIWYAPTWINFNRWINKILGEKFEQMEEQIIK